MTRVAGQRSLRRPPLAFRGWAVVAGSFTVQAISFGAIYSFPAFAVPVRESFGASHASVTLLYAISGAMAFAVGAISGPISDRFGARWPVSIGMATIALGFLLAARAESFAEVLLCYGLMVGTGAGLAYVPALAVVQRWFVAWRGLASGIATAGVGVGTALVPLSATLLSACGSWRAAFPVAGLAIAILGLLAAQLLAPSPERCGLRPDGLDSPAREPVPSSLEGVSIGRAMAGRRFPWLMAGCLLVSAPIALPFAEIVNTARARGLDAAEALWLLGLIGLGSIIGRLALGAVADQHGRGQTLLACCLGVAASMAWWAQASSALGFAAFALAFGIFQGGFVALLPSVVVDLYGRRCAGGVIGALFAGRALAVLLAPPGMAALAGITGPDAPLLLSGGLALLGTAALALALRACPAAAPLGGRYSSPRP
ncbi:Sugar phosphate permease [Roseomonas rosea]|uniref:Sugar phosphate permease n=1 Tax=Muricoccus roseus TaxID=198092 RepID=A0A1M6D193_9PROT|nr:MFS transporter [Roseomonas rosea]SHI67027.1 Sugar phosphate permease [Roseomonas rosea]